MQNTTALEAILTTVKPSAQAIEEARTNAAISLCAIADLLDYLPENEPLPPHLLAGVSTAIRELATLGAVGLV